VSVSCDDRDRTAQDFLRYPALIAEVFSPSTEAYDRGGKFTLYRRLDSLQTYVLISSDAKTIEVYQRIPEGNWKFTPYDQAGQVQLEGLGVTLELDDIYEDVILQSER
jgi:Uma2 family endonuclease